MILCLSGTPKSVADGLVRGCGCTVYEPFRKAFPDGEQYLRIDIDREADVAAIIQSTYPDQDRKIVELYLALEALSGLGIKADPVILLYTAYARQDKRFLRGEPISIKALYQGLKILGVDRVVTVDIHSPKVFGDMGFKHINILPHSFMISTAGLNVDMVLAPDKGALYRAEKVAKDLGVKYDYLDKFRDRVTGEIVIDDKRLDVANKNIVIVDDIISTGKTLAKAVELLYKAKASHVYAVITHALLSNYSIEVISKSGIDMLLIANTIDQKIELPKWIKAIDISPMICEVL